VRRGPRFVYAVRLLADSPGRDGGSGAARAGQTFAWSDLDREQLLDLRDDS
jgi:hypothetical protein